MVAQANVLRLLTLPFAPEIWELTLLLVCPVPRQRVRGDATFNTLQDTCT